MNQQRFRLLAEVSSNNLVAIRPVLEGVEGQKSA